MRFYAVKRFFLYALFVTTILAACSKKNDVVPDTPTTTPTPSVKSSLKNLSAITITKADNPSIASDGYVYKAGSTFYVTIPVGGSLSALKANFNISDKASIRINGNLVSGNSATLNLTTTLDLDIVAEDGSTATFNIQAQNGIKEIDQMIYPFIEKYGIAAASYAVGKNSLEDVVYKNASGYAVVETRERANPNTWFRLASMSKQHTAIAIMTLIEKGKIGIDDLVFGPTGILKASFPTVGAKSAKVTVRHLLEHTAGYTGDPMFSSSYVGYTLDQRIQVMLNSTQSEPNTVFTYYNMGYGTLGKIIEVVTGKDYETYLKEIYAPAGVEVYVAKTAKANKRSNEAAYYAQNGSSGYGNDMEVIKAAGGVLINTDNLFKVLYSVDGGTKKPDIINSTTRALMFTPSTVTRSYAKGWRTGHSLFNGYYHGGNIAGTATFWIYGEEYSVAVLLNSRSEADAFDVDLIVLTNNIMKKAKELGL
jgi:CubicO group peptidase (beta-lactamase class C family)